MAVVNTAVWLVYTEVVKSVNPKNFQSKEKYFFFSFFCVYMRSWILAELTVAIISQHTLSQIIMPYTFNRAVCLLHLHKTGGKRLEIIYVKVPSTVSDTWQALNRWECYHHHLHPHPLKEWAERTRPHPYWPPPSFTPHPTRPIK